MNKLKTLLFNYQNLSFLKKIHEYNKPYKRQNSSMQNKVNGQYKSKTSYLSII